MRIALLAFAAVGSPWLTQCAPQFVAAPAEDRDAGSASSSGSFGSVGTSSGGAPRDDGGSASSASSAGGALPEAGPPLGEEEQAWLAAHNAARAAAQPVPAPALEALVWDESRAAEIKGWADACNYPAIVPGKHVKFISSPDWPIAALVDQMAAAGGNYSYEDHSCVQGFSNCSTYLLLVQREVRRIACSRHQCAAGEGTPPPQQIGVAWQATLCTYAPARDQDLARPY